jgi:cytochrome c biogenesis protein CcmG/thiol:disulfide interchange protein DsbE
MAALAVIVCLAAPGCSPSKKFADGEVHSLKPEPARRQAPDFNLKDAHGKTARLSDYRGKVVLLNFWATWCGPCKIEIPWFVEMEQNYKDRGFSVLGISMDTEGWDVIKPFTAEMRVNYRVLLGDDEIAQLYGGVDSLPTTFMIDRQGKIASVHLGLVSKSDYENEVEQLLVPNATDAVPAAVGDVPAVAASAE